MVEGGWGGYTHSFVSYLNYRGLKKPAPCHGVQCKHRPRHAHDHLAGDSIAHDAKGKGLHNLNKEITQSDRATPSGSWPRSSKAQRDPGPQLAT